MNVFALWLIPKVTEGVRAAVRACVEKSTNSEGRIMEVNPFADFFTKALGRSTVLVGRFMAAAMCLLEQCFSHKRCSAVYSSCRQCDIFFSCQTCRFT